MEEERSQLLLHVLHPLSRVKSFLHFGEAYICILAKKGNSLRHGLEMHVGRQQQEATRHAQVTTLMKHYVDSSESTAPYFDKILKRGA